MNRAFAAIVTVAVVAGATVLLAGNVLEASVRPTIPMTPGVETLRGTLVRNTRTFEITASEFEQKLANFPIERARFWGYEGSTPGPTLLAWEGERIRFVLRNQLPVPTTVHFHGMHMPNEDDGTAGISQINPVPPGGSHVYAFRPGHPGTFAYHSHTDGAVQELRGLDGFFIVLPREVPASERVDRDYAMTLQQFAPPSEGALVDPMPPAGHFPFSTINGKTGEASRRPLNIERGDRIRIRLYNASNSNHSMHLHGHDFVVVSRNGHPVAPADRNEQQTVDVAPGAFFEIEWTANNPGNWPFHCHFPHHTANHGQSGWHGSPVGMTRIFHYRGYAPVPEEYFEYEGEGG